MKISTRVFKSYDYNSVASFQNLEEAYENLYQIFMIVTILVFYKCIADLQRSRNINV